MPAIRDGRGQLHVHDMGVPPADPPPPVERSRVSAQRMADFAAERAAAAEQHSRRVREGTAASKARQPKEDPVPAPAHHDAGTNRIREQVAEGAAAARRSGRKPGMRDARQIALATSLTPNQDAAIDALRVHGSRAAAAEALGLSKMAFEARLNEAAQKGLLPRDLPDLPFRFRSQGQEASAPATAAAVEPVHVPAPVAVTPPGPILEVLLPCNDCVHAVVCSLKASATAWAGLLRAAPALDPPHDALGVAALSIACDHHLEAVEP